MTSLEQKLKGYEDLMPTEEDLLYEEELLRNPYSLKLWWRYIQDRKDAPTKRRYLIFERALKALPGSYKLWYAYLKERREAVRGLSPDHPAVDSLNNTFERALVSMHKMPRIWLDYLEFLTGQGLITRTRRAFDRALQSLPVMQHERVWVLYLRFLGQPGIPVETALRVYRRYLMLEPGHAEEFIAYLKAKDLWGEAARRLADVVNDESFRSLEGKTRYQLWLELCDVITKHPNDVTDLKVEAIIRHGIRKFTDEVGRLWIALADFFIRRGLFERARDVYEEGISSVMTVRDFSLVFDAYTQFEESVLQAKMEAAAEEEDAAPPSEDDDGADFLLRDTGDDVDLRLARLEHLIERRPELLSSVILRQNPHNVHEWHKRARLFDGQPLRQVQCFTEAVTTVDPAKATGKPHTLWVAFAKVYEKHGDLDNARIILDKAASQPLTYVDDLAEVYCEWAEMELRHNRFKDALDVLHSATAEPPGASRRRTKEEEAALSVQQRIYRSPRVWNMLCDLEESLGSLDSTKAVYYRMMELRVCSPQTVLNFALLLKEAKYFEEAFQVYERGVGLFRFPHVRPIWQAYLSEFVARYEGKKLERARDLFEQCLGQAPKDESKPFFLQYADLEERYGLSRRAMQVYDRACRTVPLDQRLSVYDVYLRKAQEFFGVTKVREVYEGAIEAPEGEGLSDVDTKALCVRYALMEKKLGEIDRARAIFVHASQFADPRTDKSFWSEWNSFEVAHGNEDTFREMLRIKRSVAASYSMVHVPGPGAQGGVPVAGGAAAPAPEAGKAAVDPMASLEAAAAPGLALGTSVPGFVSAGTFNPNNGKEAEEAANAKARKGPTRDTNEIELGDGEEGGGDGDGEAEPFELAQKAIPKAVFGSVAAGEGEDGEGGEGPSKRRKVE